MQSNLRIFRTLIHRINNINNGTTRLYYTNRLNKESLYSRISPLGNPSLNLTPELDEWVEKGKKVRFGELKRIIHDLRKRKRFSQALQVSEWMNKKGIFSFTPIEHAVQLDLIGKAHGYVHAEGYFNNLMDQEKTDKTYGALLHCYARQRQTDKSLSHLQKMKEKGFTLSPLTYNDIMCLHTNISQHEKVPEILTEMKEDGVPPDNLSYRICINSYGVRSDIEGMETILKEMESQSRIVMDWNTYTVVANFYIKAGIKDKANQFLKKAEERLDNKDGLGYNHLISLHAQLGNKGKVHRLWDLEKSACKRCINRDYINMLESLVRLGELEEAEKLLKEWESSGNCYDFRVPNTIIVGYTNRHLYKKAEAMLLDVMEKGNAPTPDSWGRVAAGYLYKGEMEKALECMKAALSLHVKNKRYKPNLKVITSILSSLGEKGSIEDVEAFIDSLRTVFSINRQMYHALMKGYIKSGKAVDGLLNSMKADQIDEDEETKMILGMKQNTS
ncbi:unnamed protein product [Ilex paraguariensis]|uniref:Pentatricopeptide repeat-containing protein n=1 Tax=Ilex paraguariensis TaxID=185542 RepID=A0ABC8S5M7_9AQUA